MAASMDWACCRSKVRLKPMFQLADETLRLRVKRKLEDRCGADAFEQNALNLDRARSHHRYCRCHAHGHRDRRNPGWIRQEHGHFWRRCALRFTVAVETCG